LSWPRRQAGVKEGWQTIKSGESNTTTISAAKAKIMPPGPDDLTTENSLGQITWIYKARADRSRRRVMQ
jgi:hypothetical protein